MKPISFQHLWSSATFTWVLKAFGLYPEEGFEISCASRFFLLWRDRGGCAGQASWAVVPTEGPCCQFWGWEGSQPLRGLVLSTGAGSALWGTWLHHSSPPTLPGVICWGNSLGIISYSFLPEAPDASSALVGSGRMRHWGWACLCSLCSELIISVASSGTHFISAIPWAMLSRKAKSLLYKMKL